MKQEKVKFVGDFNQSRIIKWLEHREFRHGVLGVLRYTWKNHMCDQEEGISIPIMPLPGTQTRGDANAQV